MSNIPVFLPSDNNYVPYLAQTIVSILSNTNSFIEIYVLDSGISEENQNRIKSLKNKFNNFTLEFLRTNVDKYFKNYKLPQHLNLSTFNRLLIPQLKPNLTKVIYIDSDVVVCKDIKELYEIDLENYALGAAWDNSRALFNTDTKELLELSENYKYFNAGVLLIDITKWIENNIIENLFEIQNKYNNKILHADETLLNKYFDNNYKTFDIKFNYTDYDVLNSPNSEIIIRHFATPMKPWNSNYCFLGKNIAPLKNFDDFWKNLKLTDFYDEVKESYNKAINKTPFTKRMSMIIEKQKN